MPTRILPRWTVTLTCTTQLHAPSGRDLYTALVEVHDGGGALPWILGQGRDPQQAEAVEAARRDAVATLRDLRVRKPFAIDPHFDDPTAIMALACEFRRGAAIGAPAGRVRTLREVTP